MNMPGFTADATLYKTSGRYQTSRNMINLPTQMIYAAEVIEVHGCRPGTLQLGEGEDMVCIDPNDPWDGHDGGEGPPGGGPSGGGPSQGGGGGTPPKRPPKPPPKEPPPKPLPYRDCTENEIASFGSGWDQLKQDCQTYMGANYAAVLRCRNSWPRNESPLMCCASRPGRPACVDMSRVRH